VGGDAAPSPAGKGDDFDMVFGDGDKGRPPAADAASKISLSREERIVYEQVTGTATVQEIIDRTMLSEFETCRAMFDLMNRNLIVPVAAAVPAEAAPRPKKRVAVAGQVGRVLMLAVLALAAAGIAASRLNPFNAFVPLQARGPIVEALRREQAILKAERIVAAATTYAVRRQAPPAAAADLVGDGLLAAEDLRDPWGGEIDCGFSRAGFRARVRTGPDGGEHVEERPYPD
jgi:hypothetical protein